MGIHKYTNTNTQRHKDTYTAYDKVPERPSMCYIFEKRLVQGYQKLHSRVSNTQIQHMTNCQKDPACAIFLKIGLFKDIKNDIPVCQTHKYKNTNTKNTNTKIQHMTKCQKDPACGKFLKRGLFKDNK